MNVAVRLEPATDTKIGITHHVTVPLQHEVYQAARRYADDEGIKLETALAQAVRSFMGCDE